MMSNNTTKNDLIHRDVSKYDSLLGGSGDFVVESTRRFKDGVRSSNSALSGQFLTFPQEMNVPSLSLDRVSIVVSCPEIVRDFGMDEEKREVFANKLYEKLKSVDYIDSKKVVRMTDGNHKEVDTPINSTQNYHYHFRLKNGLDLQLFPRRMKRRKFKSSNSDVEKDFINEFGGDLDKLSGELWVQFPQKCWVRLEWNPNKVDATKVETLFKVIRAFCDSYGKGFNYEKDVWITRFDLAIDYFFDIPIYGLYHTMLRTSHIDTSKGHGVETVYFGNSRSELSICAYNKAVEQNRTLPEGEKVTHPWFRIESRCKKTLPIGSITLDQVRSIFNGLFMYTIPKENTVSDWKMKLILIGARMDSLSAVINMIPNKNTRKSYLNKLRKCPLDLHPNIVAYDGAERVWGGFNSQLKQLFL